MKKPFGKKHPLGKNPIELTTGEALQLLTKQYGQAFPEAPLFIETGGGNSTQHICAAASSLNGRSVTFEAKDETVSRLQKTLSEQYPRSEFISGNSLESIPPHIKGEVIHFLFLDSAASAMHTFKEFLLCESALETGSCLLIDNAALPDEPIIRSPCRKGKILVPYLLASPYWQTMGFPFYGESCVFAVLHAEPIYADPHFEDPKYIQRMF